MAEPLAPTDAAAAAAMLADAKTGGQPVMICGHRTKLRTLPDSDRARPMSTAGLRTGFAHYAGDLVATVPAGWTLRQANEALMTERQWIPLDPPFGDTATIGGIVAANDSGPRRQRYGAPRDLIIGMEVALVSGSVARSGGRVVKNVAGYDLGRLFCGSRGSLGLITSITFKLSPTSAASRTVVARFATPQLASAAALELGIDASLTPSTLELSTADCRLLVRYETTERVAALMADRTRERLRSRADVVVLQDEAETRLWTEHQRAESATAGLAIRLSVLPTASGHALDDVARLATEFGVEWSATGRPALGVLRVLANGERSAMQRFTAALHVASAMRGGHMQSDGDLHLLDDELGPLGDPGTAVAVGASVKKQFDPDGVLPYPWSRS